MQGEWLVQVYNEQLMKVIKQKLELIEKNNS